jgi:hypothetical protein
MSTSRIGDQQRSPHKRKGRERCRSRGYSEEEGSREEVVITTEKEKEPEKRGQVRWTTWKEPMADKRWKAAAGGRKTEKERAREKKDRSGEEKIYGSAV